MLALQTFGLQFLIEYICGQNKIIPDLLSRDPWFGFDSKELEVFNNVFVLPVHVFTITEISSNLQEEIITAQSDDYDY